MTLLELLTIGGNWTKKRCDSIKKYVRENPDSVRETNDDFGASTLQVALRRHAPLEVVQAIIKECPDVIEMTDDYRTNSLMTACEAGADLEMIKFLYEQDPDAIYGRTGGSLHYDFTPLHMCCTGGKTDLEVFEFLIEKGPKAVGDDYCTSNGLTVLHIAVAYCCSGEILRLILRKCPESVWIDDCDGNLPLNFADSDADSDVDDDASSTGISLLLEAQIRHDNGICFENEDEEESPWGISASVATGTLNVNDRLRDLVNVMGDNVKEVRLKNVQFKKEGWTHFERGLASLHNLQKVEMENVSVEGVDDFLGRHFIISQMVKNNPNLTTLQLNNVGRIGRKRGTRKKRRRS